MLKPSASELMKAKKIDSKYTLVIATAKRAREIFTKKDNVFVECKSDKPVSIAVNEIAENKVTLRTGKEPAISDNETTLNDILEQEAYAEREAITDLDAVMDEEGISNGQDS
ncbi:MAG: DNA-directed RNA polymerase subunit omega [Clostridia bacterium]|nr:DNA-directed RNA polymerase subunit omega [Clostridia bacterium]